MFRDQSIERRFRKKNAWVWFRTLFRLQQFDVIGILLVSAHCVCSCCFEGQIGPFPANLHFSLLQGGVYSAISNSSRKNHDLYILKMFFLRLSYAAVTYRLKAGKAGLCHSGMPPSTYRPAEMKSFSSFSYPSHKFGWFWWWSLAKKTIGFCGVFLGLWNTRGLWDPEKSDLPMAENPLCLKVWEAPVDQVINNVSLDPTYQHGWKISKNTHPQDGQLYGFDIWAKFWIFLEVGIFLGG